MFSMRADSPKQHFKNKAVGYGCKLPIALPQVLSIQINFVSHGQMKRTDTGRA